MISGDLIISVADDQVNGSFSPMTSDTSTTPPPAADAGASAVAGASPRLPPPLRENIGFLLAKTHLNARELGNAALEVVGLEVREFGALAILEDEGTVSQQALSALQRCDRTTMVAIVDHLEAEGLVERRRNPADRRAYALEITADGRRRLKRAKKLVEGAHEELLGSLSESERRQLGELLRRILAG
jgi:DNA-binding MarR family transcriptional regulator